MGGWIVRCLRLLKPAGFSSLSTQRRIAGLVGVAAVILAGVAAGVVPGLVQSAGASTSTSGLVIDAVYGGGGVSGSDYANDFVELFNAGSSPVSLAGLSLQYSTLTTTGGSPTTEFVTPLDGDVSTLQPGQYYLLQGEAGGAGGTAPLPTTPDQTASAFNVSAQTSIVALVDGTSAITLPNGAQTTLPPDVIDSVSTGGSVGYYLGKFATRLYATTGDWRNEGGCANTLNNGDDLTEELADGSATSSSISGVTATTEGPIYNSQSVVQPCADLGAPETPDSVAASPGNSSATISWGAVSGASGYEVFEASTPGGENPTLPTSTPVCTETSATTCDVTGLENGTTYYFVVVATVSSDMSPASTEVSTTPAAAAGAPPAPTGVTAVSGDGTASVSWSSVSGASGYNVYESTTPGSENPNTASPVCTETTETTCDLTGLANGETYYFVVTATDSSGASAPSTEVSATPSSAPTTPPAPTGVSAVASDGSATVSWDAVSGATGYDVYEATSSGDEHPSSATPVCDTTTSISCSVTGLTDGTTYYFVVTATNTAGTSSASSEVTATPEQPTTNTDGLVIAAVYGAGGDNGSTYANDFVELFNSGNKPVSLSGLSIQTVENGAGPLGDVTPLDDVELAPGQHYLVQGEGDRSSGGGTAALPIAPDQTNTQLKLGGRQAIVAVVDGTTAVQSLPSTSILDLVGTASEVGYAEGVFAPAMSATAADWRADSGCQNTDNNAEDFISETIQGTLMANDASAPTPCATVGSNGLVISAIYGGGGASGSYYANDFVELFNAGTQPESLAGLSLQEFKYSQTGDNTPTPVAVPAATTALNAVTLAPGQHYLLQGPSAGGGDLAPLDPNSDQTLSDSFVITDSFATVVLVQGTTSLASLPSPTVVDEIGTGAKAQYYLGAQAPELASVDADYRNDGGCENTADNATDFTLENAQSTTLYNSSSALVPCGTFSVPKFHAYAMPVSGGAPSYPEGIAVSSTGSIYYSSTETNDLFEMQGHGSTALTLLAGNNEAVGGSGDGGAAGSATLDQPSGVAVDNAGDVFVTDTSNDVVREIPATSGTQYGIAMTAGDIYTIAGDGTEGYTGDGNAATAAELDEPHGLAVNDAGDLFIADSGDDAIREVAPDGTITTFAGTGTAGYTGDGGPATAAELDHPYAVAVDAEGDVYIADSGNDVIRRVDASNAAISTVAGDHAADIADDYAAPAADSGDGGPATAAELDDPEGVAVNQAGDLFIADTFGNEIQEVSPDGTISTVAEMPPDGPADVAVDNTTGDLYVADTSGASVDVITGLSIPGPATAGVAPASTLNFTTEPPASSAANSPFTVTVSENAAGGVQSSDNSTVVSLELAPGTPGTKAAGLSCEGGDSATLQEGTVTFSCSVADPADGLTLEATASSAYVAPAISSAFTVPHAVAVPTAVAVASSTGTAQLSWKAVGGASGYSVYDATAAGAEDDAGDTACTTNGATTCEVTGLVDDQLYYFVVEATDTSGSSEASSEVSAKPLAAPGDVAATSSSPGAADLAWNAVRGATGYDVYEATATGVEQSANAQAVCAETDGTTCEIGNLTNGTKYFFVVVATDSSGASVASQEVSATPQGAPSRPTDLTATAEDGSVSLAWKAPASDGGSAITGYTVYSARSAGAESASGSGACTATGKTSCSVSGLTDGTTYYFVVVATNAVGSSTVSLEASATPQAAAGSQTSTSTTPQTTSTPTQTPGGGAQPGTSTTTPSTSPPRIAKLPASSPTSVVLKPGVKSTTLVEVTRSLKAGSVLTVEAKLPGVKKVRKATVRLKKTNHAGYVEYRYATGKLPVGVSTIKFYEKVGKKLRLVRTERVHVSKPKAKGRSK
jgi:Lamin Tail Domain/Fibronectin type III domain/NHL repeat